MDKKIVLTSLTLEQRETENRKKLAAKATKPDYNFRKEQEKLSEGLKARAGLERRSKESLHVSLALALQMILEVEVKEVVAKAFHKYCKDEKLDFRPGTSIAYRVARALLTRDEQRASDYGKALRGAIIKLLTPAELEGLLRSKKETLSSLMDVVHVVRPQKAKAVMPPGNKAEGQLQVSFSPLARKQFPKVKKPSFRLGVIRLNSKKKTVFISSFFKDPKIAVQRFKKKVAEK
ncbi:MAG: hypothetical protein B0A82_17435 [Alkalinema sp. CACIAM 70d]|nr:MAG: hypothetical protein B0A82_17435 [Alkalinema sp. CACIAM 70d]